MAGINPLINGCHGTVEEDDLQVGAGSAMFTQCLQNTFKVLRIGLQALNYLGMEEQRLFSSNWRVRRSALVTGSGGWVGGLGPAFR